jgi:restriction system protein
VSDAIPKFHETFIPILSVLSSGELLHYKDLRIKVRDQFYSDLPEELLTQRTKTGDLLILNRIGWGKAYLKAAKIVEQPERAMVKITDKGKTILQTGAFTLQDLKKDPEYIQSQLDKEKDKKGKSEAIDLEEASPQDLIDEGFGQIEKDVKSQILELLKTLDPFYFEKVILMLLKKMGYGDFVETSKTGDGGIDGIINEDKLGLEKIYIQAKRYTENKVREREIRNFIGAMSGDTSKGVFATTSEFDEGAKAKAHDAHHKIILLDGNTLADLMYEYGVGLQVTDVYEMKEIDENFFDES